MADSFTQKAIKAITCAQEEANRVGLSEIATEHLLMGLLRCEIGQRGWAAQFLQNTGITLDEVRAASQQIRGLVVVAREYQQAAADNGILFTEATQRVMNAALEQARARNQVVCAEHLLLGLLLEGTGVAVKLLEDHGTGEKARQVVADLLAHVLDETPGVGEPEDQVAFLRNKIDAWERRINLARQHGNERLAQEAIENKVKYERMLAALLSENVPGAPN